MAGVHDPYIAFCLDQAVYTWGRHVEYELHEATHKQGGPKSKPPTPAQQRSRYALAMKRLMGDKTEEKPAPGKFRDPAALVGNK